MTLVFRLHFFILRAHWQRMGSMAEIDIIYIPYATEEEVSHSLDEALKYNSLQLDCILLTAYRMPLWLLALVCWSRMITIRWVIWVCTHRWLSMILPFPSRWINRRIDHDVRISHILTLIYHKRAMKEVK